MTSKMNVDFDNLRNNLCDDMIDVLSQVSPLVDNYRKNNYNVSIPRGDAESLFEALNTLRSTVGILMCVYSEEHGIKDLSKIADGLTWIEYDEFGEN